MTSASFGVLICVGGRVPSIGARTVSRARVRRGRPSKGERRMGCSSRSVGRKVARRSCADRRHLVMDVTSIPGRSRCSPPLGRTCGGNDSAGTSWPWSPEAWPTGGAVGEFGALLATVQDGGEVVGAVMQTPPWCVFLARMPAAGTWPTFAVRRSRLSTWRGRVDWWAEQLTAFVSDL
jgi:hypothetical protein